MLVAKKEDGTFFSLIGSLEKRDLLMLRERKSFYCPVCQEEVELRLGDKKRWHFAHRKGKTCSFEAEAESAYHIQGKRLLYDWLLSHHRPVELEPYLPQLKQRPDLLLNTPKEQIALEFQCATIDPQLFMKRTAAFLKDGIRPIWILGGNRLKRIGDINFQIPQMDWLAARNTNPDSINPALLYFCPISKQFATLTNITPYGTSKSIAHLKFHSLDKYSVADLTKLPATAKNQIPPDWLKVKQNWRMKAFRYRSRPYLYVQKLFGSLSLIPPAAGWPTPYYLIIETPCFLWQSWLFHRFVTIWPNAHSISLYQVHQAFQKLVDKGIFQLRRFPLISGIDEKRALLEYLMCLRFLGYLRQTGKTQFYKRIPYDAVQTREDIQRFDSEYFEKLSRLF